MALSTYAELVTAMANWTHRADLTARIPEFIVMGEARIGREVFARQMEQRVSTTPTNQYITLPSDYKETRAVRVKGSNVGFLTFLTPDVFFNKYPSTSGVQIREYTVFGDEMIFPGTPNGDVELWYYKKLARLSSELNTLYTDNPDLYLNAGMAAAQPFMKNIPGLPMWEALFVQVKNSVNEAHKNGRYAPGMATVAA